MKLAGVPNFAPTLQVCLRKLFFDFHMDTKLEKWGMHVETLGTAV
jgi:hypothetical protein